MKMIFLLNLFINLKQKNIMTNIEEIRQDLKIEVTLSDSPIPNPEPVKIIDVINKYYSLKKDVLNLEKDSPEGRTFTPKDGRESEYEHVQHILAIYLQRKVMFCM